MDFEKPFLKLQNGNDVRGAAIATDTEPLTLTPDLVSYIAAGFLSFLEEKLGKKQDQIRIGIGRDSRITGSAVAEACIRGLGAARIYDCGMASTPAMFQSTVLEESNFDASVMITASHLPFNRNGIKFFTKDGALEKSELTQILETAARLAGQYGKEDDLALISYGMPQKEQNVETFDIVSAYSRSMQETIKRLVGTDQPLKGLHIVVDAGNGAAGFFPGQILAPLGADVSGSVYLEPDGMFPNHVPNPENKTAMKAISQATVAAGADLGVIFDCDGDRAAVVFSDGTPVNRNTLIALLAAIIKDEHPGSVVVTDSVTSDELTEFLEEKLGMKHFRFKRGYKNVIDKGIELCESGQDCELAIETSGHGAFRENYFSDDGAYLSVRIICRLAVMKREGAYISSLIDGLRQPAESEEVRFDIGDQAGDDRDFKEYGTWVLDSFREFALADPRFHIVEPNYEGIRIAFDDEQVKGWLLIRKSLHDPVLPMNIEAQAPGGVELIKDRIRPFFEKCSRLSV